MLFSVIIPTHYREKTLFTTLESLKKQTLPAEQFEVLVIPSPHDTSISSVKPENYPFVLRMLSEIKDPYRGKSASFKRNTGAQNARAPWLAFIDDDCVANKEWLAQAQQVITTQNCAGIEGSTLIPEPPEKTYTYKGLQRLSRAGGYQTCNMFYRKDIFIECGGFDLFFPFYLEDTDLAWSVLDRGHTIVFAPQCRVEHPVPPPEVKRLLSNAARTRLLPYLYKKHPNLYTNQHWKALHRFHWLFLTVHFVLLWILITHITISGVVFVLASILLLSVLYTAYQLRDCSFSAQEALRMMCYYTITPWITLFQLHRGNWEQKTFLWK